MPDSAWCIPLEDAGLNSIKDMGFTEDRSFISWATWFLHCRSYVPLSLKKHEVCSNGIFREPSSNRHALNSFTRCSPETCASIRFVPGFQYGKSTSLLTSRQFRASKGKCQLLENLQKVKTKCLQILDTYTCIIKEKFSFRWVFGDICLKPDYVFFRTDTFLFWVFSFSFLKSSIILHIKHVLH